MCVCLCLPGCSVFPGVLVSGFLSIEGYFGGPTLISIISCNTSLTHFSYQAVVCLLLGVFLWKRSFGGSGWIFAVVLSWEVCPGEQGVRLGFPTPLRVALCPAPCWCPVCVFAIFNSAGRGEFSSKCIKNATECLHFVINVHFLVLKCL